ncbi:MAG: antitoxin ChpS [Cyanobacteriota bacterium erpe_2018_sw_21hr_WHONDRS-SW48-000092_B_bin.40]|jgi:antitoxin ChpS|nr:antitoxin ChpS [Cyanobacteriota bacterium erpe_2018_sw_21hr_WHONDRS-SW48-000092_B_bin.40]
MHKTKLRKVGNSVVVAIPAKLLTMLQLKADDTVSITVVSNRLIIEPLPRLRYTLAELLASSDYSEAQPPEEREWVDGSAVGREIA